VKKPGPLINKVDAVGVAGVAAPRRHVRLVFQEFRFNGTSHLFRDPVLDAEHVAELQIIAVRPQLMPRLRVAELGIDANLRPRLAHAARQQITNVELLGDFLDVDGNALEPETRVTVDHRKPTEARQGADDVFSDPVGEIFLLGVADLVGEGQDRDRRLAAGITPFGSRFQCLLAFVDADGL
jgi:hypothetical protein